MNCVESIKNINRRHGRFVTGTNHLPYTSKALTRWTREDPQEVVELLQEAS
jgi:hypothetical protein